MAEKTKQQKFYDKYYSMVADSVKGTGLFPETVIAQMAIESNWGESGLSSKHNNYFGIKGKGVNMASDEEVGGTKVSKKSDFRTYNSVEDSVKDYINVIKTQGGGKTYADVRNAKTPEAQAEALGNSPYATGSKYGNSIQSTIKANKPYTTTDVELKVKSNTMNDNTISIKERVKTSKQRLEDKKMEVWKAKDKIITDFQRGEGNKKDRFAQLVRKSKKDGLSKNEAIEANNIVQEANSVYNGGAEFSRMKGALMNDIAYPYFRDEYNLKQIEGKTALEEMQSKIALGKGEDKDRYQKEYELATAEFEKNYGESSEASQALKEFDETHKKYDEEVAAGKSGSTQSQANKIGGYDFSTGSATPGVTPQRFLTAMGGIGGNFEAVEEIIPKETIPPVEATDDGSGGKGKTKTESRVDDVNPETGEKINYDKYGKPITDLKANMEADQKALDDYNAIESEKFNFEYAPDNQSDNDVFGNIVDVGRGIAGMMGATEDVPTYERGGMFKQAMGEAERMRNEGLSPEEKDYRNRQSETAYAYNVKNIRRGAGGSAGAYLGNVQSAAAGLYDEYGKTAATDEAARRLNRQNFQGMALQDESINRQIFQDDLSQTMMTKEAGAGLVQDAITNMKERNDYKKQFGKDSPYYNYMRAKTEDTESSAFYRDKADADRVNKARSDYEYRAEKSKNAYNESNRLAPGEEKIVESNNEPQVSDADVLGNSSGVELVNSVTSPRTAVNKETGQLEKQSTFSRGEPQDVASIEKPTAGKSTIKASENRKRANEITIAMEKLEPDDPKFEKLSKELESLKY